MDIRGITINRDLQFFGYGKPGDLVLKYCREVTQEENGIVIKHFVMRR